MRHLMLLILLAGCTASPTPGSAEHARAQTERDVMVQCFDDWRREELRYRKTMLAKCGMRQEDYCKAVAQRGPHFCR